MQKIWSLVALFIFSLLAHQFFITSSDSQVIVVANTPSNIVFAWDFHGVIAMKQRWPMAKKMIGIIAESDHKWLLIKTLANPHFWHEVKKVRKKYKTTETIFANLKDKYPALEYIEPQFYEFLQLYTPNEGTLAIIDAVGRAGYKQYLTSNISPRALEDMQELYPAIFQRFSGIYRIGKMEPHNHCYSNEPKPYTEYYRGLRQYLTDQGIAATTTIIFIDDMLENVEATRKANVNIDAIQFISPKQLEKELTQRGINLSGITDASKPIAIAIQPA